MEFLEGLFEFFGAYLGIMGSIFVLMVLGICLFYLGMAAVCIVGAPIEEWVKTRRGKIRTKRVWILILSALALLCIRWWLPFVGVVVFAAVWWRVEHCRFERMCRRYSRRQS